MRLDCEPMKELRIRLPDDLHAWLAETAEKDHRSLNGELVVLLERFRRNTRRRAKPTADDDIAE